MGKKYYCDYCNRSFNDDKTARTKHANSVAHQQAKKEHYMIFREPEQILAEESQKLKCKKLFQHGYCAFGVNCNFTHYSDEDLDRIKSYVEAKQRPEQRNEVCITNWLEKFKTDTRTRMNECHDKLPSHELHDCLKYQNDLPVSLLPFDVQSFVNAELAEWG